MRAERDPIAALEDLGTLDVPAALEDIVPCGRSSRFGFRRHAAMHRAEYQAIAALPAANADEWAARGRALRILGEYAAAGDCLKKALALDAGHAYAGAFLWELQDALRGRDDERLLAAAVAPGAPRRERWLVWRSVVRLRRAKSSFDLAAGESLLADLRAAVKAEPDGALAFVVTALVQEKMSLKTAALANLRRAVALAPREGWIHQLRAAVHRKRGAVHYFGPDVEQAMWLDEGAAFVRLDLGAADQYLRRHPKAHWLHVYRGDARRSPPHNDFPGALEDFRRAVAIAPGCSWAWAHLSKALMAQGETSAAVEAIGKAIELHAECGWFHVWRGEIRRRTGALKSAVKDFDWGLRLDRDYELGYAWRGAALRALGRLPEALADLSLATRLDPLHAWTLNEESLALRGLGRIEESLRSLDAAHALDAKFSWRQRGQTLREALLPLERVLAASPRLASAWSWGGETLMSLGEPAAAVRSLRKGLKIEPGRRWARAWLGRALALCGRRREAVEALDRAIASEPRYSCAWAWRGRVQHERGRLEPARRDLTQAARLDPKSAWIWEWLGEAQESRGNRAAAEAAYSASLRLHRGNADALSGLARVREGKAGILLGVLACAALGAAACAPTGPQASARADGLIAQSEALAAQTEDGPFRSFSTGLKECRDAFSVDQALAAVPQGAFDPYPGGVVFDLKEFYAAQAYAASNIGICDKLAAVPPPGGGQRDDWAQLCRIRFQGFVSVGDLFRGSPDFPAACHKNVEWSGRELSGEEIDEVCRAYLRAYTSHDDVDSLCGMKVLLRAGVKRLAGCRAMFSALRGDESRCSDSTHAEDYCRGVARYARAFASGDPSQCGDSTPCWILSGKQEKAQEYARRVENAYCGQRPSVSTPAREVRSSADRGLALLAGARSRVPAAPASALEGAGERWRKLLNSIVLESERGPQ